MRAPVVLLALLALARGASADPAVLLQVPAETLGFAGVDLAATRASPALTAGVARLVHATGLDAHADRLRAATSLVIAGVPGAAAMRIVERSATARGALAFGALWLDARLQRRLAQLLPDLGAIRWIAGTLETSSSGFTLSGSAAVTDPYAAAGIAVAIGMGRKVVTSQLAPSVAIAVDKIAITAMGASLRITATWSEADLAALATL